MNSGRSRGFTLIEAITVVALLGALAAIAGFFIVEPFRAADDIRRRAELVDEAQLTIERMTREIRTALPNSVRVDDNGSNLFAVEIVSTRTGGRYRRLPAPGGGSDRLNRTQSSDTFDALGGLPGMGSVQTAGAGNTNCANNASPGDCISVYNTGQNGFNVYARDNIAKITATDAVNDRLTYDNGGTMPAFAAHSPQQRFFVVDDVVSYVCNTSTGQLTRHAGYGLNGSQSLSPGGSTSLMARDVSGCGFTYQAGSSTRSGLVTLRIALSRDNETVELLQQVHVVNAP